MSDNLMHFFVNIDAFHALLQRAFQLGLLLQQHLKNKHDKCNHTHHHTLQKGNISEKMTGSLEFIGLLLFMAGVELNPGPRTPDNNKTEIGKGQNDADDTQNISTGNIEEICEGTTPRQTGDNEADGAKNISAENMQEISGESTPSNAPKQTVDLSDDGPHNVINDGGVSQRSEEPVADKGKQSQHEGVGSNLMPLRESELVDFSAYITYDIQGRISVLLGFDLNKVDTLRSKHRENVTGVSIDLLIDWMRCNPQQTNRLVSNNR